MKISNVARFLMGSAILYTVMAACAGSERAQSSGNGGSDVGASGNGGGLVDALTDPVPEAHASPTDCATWQIMVVPGSLSGNPTTLDPGWEPFAVTQPSGANVWVRRCAP